MTAPMVRFDHGPNGGGTVFDNARRVITATTPNEVPAAFEAMQSAQAEGLWLAGFASYEPVSYTHLTLPTTPYV